MKINVKVGLGMLALLGMGQPIALTAWAKAPAAVPSKASATLDALGEGGENVYDAAKAGDWKAASAKTAGLEKAAQALPPRWKEMANQFRLASSLGRLRSSVQAHRKWEAMHEANRVTLFAARLSRGTAPRVPVEVTLLDVYGRELEVGAMRGDRASLARAQCDLAVTWAQIRPSIEQRGGAKQATTFGALLAQVEKAQTPAQLARLAIPILDEVDNLEKVFTK